ncbi:MAG TPA: pantetheine-phosphate adenylyltransferase [Atribacteraceae bacterium]|nr:pantetheine-phosphate adenylyltransferase [Atribacteraceae bacterium]
MIVIYPGSFDPVTNGHLDIIARANGLFQKVIVAILHNPAKDSLFTASERATMLKEAVREHRRVEVEVFDGLLVNFARARKCRLVLRGLRAISDYEYETQLALTNRRLAPEIETFFLPTSMEFSYLNSSAVKEIARFGGCVNEFVPPVVAEALRRKFETYDCGKGGLLL